jgi:hypothetical protein
LRIDYKHDTGLLRILTRSILNGSFISSSHHGHRESVISLPDFKVINEVEASPASIEELVKRYLDPSIGRAGSTLSGELRSW